MSKNKNIDKIIDLQIFFSAPETQDEGVWKYEHLRQFCMELNGLAVALQVRKFVLSLSKQKVRLIKKNGK